MIKIEKDRRYNDFEKEVIKIIVNCEQKALLNPFIEIYSEISNKLFSSSTYLDKERNILFLKKEYVNSIRKEKRIRKEDIGAFNAILLSDFSKKVTILAKLIEDLDKSKLLVFDKSYITNSPSYERVTELAKSWGMDNN